MTEKNNTEQILSSVLEGIQKVKGQDITILDLRGIENAVCSYFVICTGGSNTQVVAISGAVQRQTPQKPWHVVVHIFQKHVREYYDIEGLWGDAQITHIKTNE